MDLEKSLNKILVGSGLKVVKAESEAIGTPIEDTLNDWRNATYALRMAFSENRNNLSPELMKKLQLWMTQVHDLDNEAAEML